jgi:hypothetical protein
MNVDDGALTTYFRIDLGRLPVFVSNGTRAMVVLMNSEVIPASTPCPPEQSAPMTGTYSTTDRRTRTKTPTPSHCLTRSKPCVQSSTPVDLHPGRLGTSIAKT